MSDSSGAQDTRAGNKVHTHVWTTEGPRINTTYGGSITLSAGTPEDEAPISAYIKLVIWRTKQCSFRNRDTKSVQYRL